MVLKFTFIKLIPYIIILIALLASATTLHIVFQTAGFKWILRYLGITGTFLILSSFIYSLRKRKVIRFVNQTRIGPQLRKYLSSVLKGFNYYIMEGKPVQKNQFGTHKWFSNN